MLDVSGPPASQKKNLELHQIFACDRGYSSKELTEFLIDSKLTLIGTTKRSLNSPFTFGEQQRIGKKQKLITERGAMSAYWETTHDSSLDAVAYQNGTGRVALLHVSVDSPFGRGHWT